MIQQINPATGKPFVFGEAGFVQTQQFPNGSVPHSVAAPKPIDTKTGLPVGQTYEQMDRGTRQWDSVHQDLVDFDPASLPRPKKVTPVVLTPAEIAAGDTIVNGKVVNKLGVIIR